MRGSAVEAATALDAKLVMPEVRTAASSDCPMGERLGSVCAPDPPAESTNGSTTKERDSWRLEAVHTGSSLWQAYKNE